MTGVRALLGQLILVVRLAGRRRAVAAWLGLLAAAFNVAAAPLLFPAPLRSTDTPFGAIVVCTSAGMVTIGGPETDRSTTPDHHAVVCDLCLPFLHGFTGALDVAALSRGHHQVTAIIHPTRNLTRRDLRAARVFGARGPPAA